MDIIKSIKNIPFIQITPIVILGVLTAVQFDFLVTIWALLICIVIGIIAYFKYSSLRFFSYFLFGISLVWLHTSDEIPLLKNSRAIFVVEEKSGEVDYICKIIKVDSIIRNENVVLIKDNKDKSKITIGDTIIANINFDLVRDSRLPNKKEYIHNKIKYFSKIDSITVINSIGAQKGKTVLEGIRTEMSVRIDSMSCSDKWKSLLSAMIIGDKRDVEYDSYNTFKECGLSHFLAISGWHISVLFIFLNILLFPLNYINNGKYVKSIIVVFIIWCYTAMIGFTPSVSRAALMFTLFQYALFTNISRNAKYNIIFSSLFLFICIDYNYIFDIGLQLSYTAILSIQLFYNRIYSISKRIRHFSINWLIKSISFIISVQILILPIILYYFGSTSTISIISNITLSLLFSILIITAITFIIFPNPISDKIIVYITSIIDKLLTEFVSWDPMVSGYYLTETEVITYFLILLFLIQLFEKE